MSRLPDVRFALRNTTPVFYAAAALILVFLFYGAVFTESAKVVFEAVQAAITTGMGWFYILSVAGFLVFVLFLRFSSFRNLKLGPDDSEPGYGYLSWFAMLFSAGMGIGLLFYSVAEPVLHYASPPTGSGETMQSARNAMRLTFFHWGVHAWAVYIVVGLSLAYYGFRRDLPLTIRSAFYPLLGDRIHGVLGHTIDTFAVLGTMFGVATSLGLGVMQVNAGLHYLFGVPEAIWVQLALIWGITAMATASVVLGLDRGIRRLSEVNLGLGLLLLVFVFVLGPTLFLLNAFVQNTGLYLSTLVSTTFETFAYHDTAWQADWTLFYWGWWIAWSPFVGMFIARISRGRTIGEFVTGVLAVPALLTFLWLTVFGNTALHLQIFGDGGIVAAVEGNVPTALFVVLGAFPLSTVTSLIAMFVVITFFVTSSDSGSLVIDIITSGGNPDPPLATRIFWALSEGGVATVLLVAGGLVALQTAVIALGLPFCIILVLMCVGLVKSLRSERQTAPATKKKQPARPRMADRPQPEGVEPA